MTKPSRLCLQFVVFLAYSLLLAACRQDVLLTPTATPKSTAAAVSTTPPIPPTATNPPTAVPSPTAASTPLPIPVITLNPPQGRAALIEQLRQVQTEVIGLVQTQQQLLAHPRLDDPEWAGDVAVQATFIQANRLALAGLTLPAAGQNLMMPLQTAVLNCETAALAEDLAGLDSCLTGLQAVSFGSNGGVGENIVTPIPLVGCSQTSVGFVPLNDLGADLYMGEQGGLYPNGQNRPPTHHLAAGLAQTVQPLASDGSPSDSGKIGFISVGMSNAALEFNAFLRLANDDPAKNTAVVIVNGAQGGWTSNKLADNPNAEFWQVLDERLAGSGLTPAQVQVVWLKEARGGVKNEPFPQEPQIFQAQLNSIVQILQSRYPNLKQLYLSSRIYGGYATGPLNPEPIAYHSGFSVKWLIEAQINGDPALNFDSAQGEVTAPWLAWGPYLWADGLTPRSDGLTWACSEFADDGTHPGDPARDKVADMLLDFFKTDEVAREWFLEGERP